jgi:hypothetical protein
VSKCLWVYKRTVELKGQTGFVEVPDDLVDAAIDKDCAEDPKGKTSYALKRRDLKTKPVSLKAKKTRKKKSIDADSLEQGAPVSMDEAIQEAVESADEPQVEN